MTDGITEPRALQVQWLEHGLLVHGTTIAHRAPALPRVHALALGAVSGLAGGAWAAASGWVGAGSTAVVLGAACAAGLAVEARAQARAVLGEPRRLLVELGRDRVSWTSLAGDRWSMRHDHEAALTDVVDAAPADSVDGATVHVRLREGAWDVPLYGVPLTDVQWLADRISEAAAAARRSEGDTPA